MLGPSGDFYDAKPKIFLGISVWAAIKGAIGSTTHVTHVRRPPNPEPVVLHQGDPLSLAHIKHGLFPKIFSCCAFGFEQRKLCMRR